LRGAGEEELRAALAALPDEDLKRILSNREWRDYSVGYRESVNDLQLEQIRDLPRVLPTLFADAAERAREAGFDGVELHYAHAYTMASFLSRRNVRSDGYGGNRDSRARLPLEVYEAVRARVGSDFVVGCRFLADEVIEGGSRVDDACDYAERFAAAGWTSSRSARAASSRTHDSLASAKPPIPTPDAAVTSACPPCEATRAAPSAATSNSQRESGRICGRPDRKPQSLPRAALGPSNSRRGSSQRVAPTSSAWRARASPSPIGTRLVREGRGDEIRRCVYTNYCEGLDQKHKEVTCQLWDRVDLDQAGQQLSKDGKRRLLAP
jgi:hypothetical protein